MYRKITDNKYIQGIFWIANIIVFLKIGFPMFIGGYGVTLPIREAIPSFLYIAMLIIFFLSLIFGNRKKYGWKLILIQIINLISSLPIIILGIGYFLLGMTS